MRYQIEIVSNPGPWSMVHGIGFMGNLNVAMNAAIIQNTKSYLKIEVATYIELICIFWLRGQDLNLRTSGYEPDYMGTNVRHPNE